MLIFPHRAQFLFVTFVMIACSVFPGIAGFQMIKALQELSSEAPVVFPAIGVFVLLLILLFIFLLLRIAFEQDGVTRWKGRVRLNGEWVPDSNVRYVSFRSGGSFWFPVIGLDGDGDDGDLASYEYPRVGGSWSVTTAANEYPLALAGDYRIVPGAHRRTERRCQRLAKWLGVPHQPPKQRSRR